MTNSTPRGKVVKALRDMYEIFVKPETETLVEVVEAKKILAEEVFYTEPKFGDIIKSYDFHFVCNCYRVGRVVTSDERFIYCDTLKRVIEGQNLPVSEDQVSFKTPLPGHMVLDGKFPRIEFLG